MEKDKIVALRRQRLKEWFSEKAVPADEKSFVSQLISGKSSFGEKAARRLEEKFGMPNGHLANPTQESSNWDANVIPAEPPRMRVPLISWVQAGMLAEIDVDCQTGDYDEWVDVCYSKPSEQSFALTVQGDSMTWTGTPNFPEGTRIVVDPNRNPQVGDYVIAKDVGTQRATFKKLITDDVNYYLKPLNPAYPMIMIDDPSMRCIGVVVEFQPVGGKL
ncbi:repressor [Formosimonas limnophila]|uniref:Repressor n=1 Tax=Formosimonas limnophila TaxID=1384487 RepID=A0A8J3CJQ3_9BURK|nr:S24 family peptidase [Formosimonas limnophila]GHA66006.1 repressor [Formosimonas limnophila]